MSETIIDNRWDAEENLLATRLAGVVSMEDVERWKAGLYRESERIPAGGTFKFLMDLRGYTVADVAPEVHQVQRLVLPIFLLEHNFRIAYFDLFEDTQEPDVERRTARCVAMAHVHHDCNKMALYNERIGKPHEQFFCELEEAREWIAGMEIPAA